MSTRSSDREEWEVRRAALAKLADQALLAKKRVYMSNTANRDAFRQAAERGDADSQYTLGSYYDDVQSPPDYAQALIWYRKAADQNHASAQNKLGILYYEGKGVKQDFNQAAQWFERAAKQGLEGAGTNLANAKQMLEYVGAAERGDADSPGAWASFLWRAARSTPSGHHGLSGGGAGGKGRLDRLSVANYRSLSPWRRAQSRTLRNHATRFILWLVLRKSDSCWWVRFGTTTL